MLSDAVKVWLSTAMEKTREGRRLDGGHAFFFPRDLGVFYRL